MRNKAVRFLTVGLVVVVLAFIGIVEAADVEVKLNSSDGSTAFEVQDAGATGVAEIDSDGNLQCDGTLTVDGYIVGNDTMVISGAASIGGDLTVTGYSSDVIMVYCATGGQDVNPGPTVINFDGLIKKDSTYTHSTITNPSRVEVEKDAWYRVSYSINYDTGGNGRVNLHCYLRKNGSGVVTASNSYGYGRNDQEDMATCTATFIVQLVKDDYVEIIAESRSSDGDYLSTNNANECWIMIERL